MILLEANLNSEKINQTNIEELKKYKKSLEEEIGGKIAEFNKITGVHVEYIDLDYIYLENIMSEQPQEYLKSVNLDLRLI